MKEHHEAKDDFIEFDCPYCHSGLSFSGKSHGRVHECPFCLETVLVPRGTSDGDGRLPLPLVSSRLSLRLLRVEDLSDWLECVKDEDSYRFLHLFSPEEEDAKRWLEKSVAIRPTQTDGHGRLDLGIVLAERLKLIGYLSFFFKDPETKEQGDFMIIINPSYRRCGYGTEALLSLFDLGFARLDLHDIRTSIDCRNTAGRRMVEKSGMRLESEWREAYRLKGEWVSIVGYGILSTDYMAAKVRGK